MNIALIDILCNPFEIEGRYSFHLASGLVRRGHAVSLIIQNAEDALDISGKGGVNIIRLATRKGTALFDETLTRYVRGYYAKLHKPYNIVQQITDVYPQMNSRIIHTLTGVALEKLWSFAHKKRAKIVHTITDYSLICRYGMRAEKVCERQCRQCAEQSPLESVKKMPDGVTALSRAALTRHIHSGWFRDSVRTVIPQAFPSLNLLAGNVEDKKFFLGYQCDDDDKRDAAFLIQALHAYRAKTGRSAPVLISGKNALRLQKRLETSCCSGITFAEAMPPERFYSLIQYAVIPSLFPEPTGLFCPESLGSGIPVVCSALGAASEIVADRHNGRVFSPTVEGLREVLEELPPLGSEEYAAMGRNALLSSIRWTPDVVALEFESLYKKLLLQ